MPTSLHQGQAWGRRGAESRVLTPRGAKSPGSYGLTGSGGGSRKWFSPSEPQLHSESTQIKSSNINLDTLIKNLDNFNNEIDKANLEQKKLLLNSILESIEWSSKDNNLIINYIGFNSNTNSLNHTSKINSKLHFSRDTRRNINV